MLATSSIPNLISGVSQQPSSMRLTTSAEEIINGWPSIVSGLNKRMPTEHIAKLTLSIPRNSIGYLIDKDSSEQYIVIVSGDDLQVYDLLGNQQTVTFPNGKSYLNAALDPIKSFRFLTIGDTTFVLNRDVVVAADEFGEDGASGYTPDATVTKVTDLPGVETVGKVYYVTSTKTYYKYVNIAGKPAIYGWQQSGGWVSNIPAGSQRVQTLPKNPSAGQTVWLEKRTAREVRSTPTSQGYTYTYIVYDSTYTKFDSVLTQSATAGTQGWQQVRLADLTTLSTVRLDPTFMGTVYVNMALANVNYNVYINGTLKATYLTPKGVDAASSVPDTAQIADEIKNDLIAAGYSLTRNGSTVTITNLTPGDKVVCTSSSGDKAMRAYTTEIDAFGNLPPNEINGRIVKVKGDVKDNGDDYYVVFNNGVWTETYGYNESGSPLDVSMPHALQRQSDGTWIFKPWDWDARNAGDRESNQNPSFIGKTINDIFLYANRMGFLSDENIILSEADNFENFYRTSLAVLVDSDPIDLAVLSSGNVGTNILRHAIGFDKDLLLMSEHNQFRLQYTQFLGPKNIEIRFATSFPMSRDVKPANLGNSVYFVDDSVSYRYAKLWEYFPKDNQVGDDADDTTAPVPEYIPSGIQFIAGSPRAKLIAVSSDNSPDTLHMYKFFWSGQNKIQNAWFKWQFNDCEKIYWAGFIDNYMYLLIERSDGTCLERMRIDEAIFLTETAVRIMLDRQTDKANLTLSYDSGTDKTTITTPWSTTEAFECVVTNDTGNVDTTIADIRLDVTKTSGNSFTVDGDITGYTDIKVGIGYTFLFTFSKPYFKAQAGQGQVAILDINRVQLRYITLNYINTAYFQTKLVYPGRDDSYTTFDGKVLGSAGIQIGTTPFVSGIYRAPLLGNNNEVEFSIVNDSPYNCTFGSAEWNGIYAPRSMKRM